MKNILVPTDFSSGSVHALNYAGFIAQKTKSNITLLWVDNTSALDFTDDDVLGRVKQEANESLEAQIQEFKKLYADVEIKSKIRTGKVYKEVANYTQSYEIDLVVLGTHGGSGFEDYWIGSNAFRTVSTVPCPVIAIRPDFDFTNRPQMRILAPVDHTLDTLAKFETIVPMAKVFDAEVQVLTLYATPLKTINRKADQSTTMAFKMLEKEGITCFQDSIVTSNITADIIRFITNSEIDLMVIMTEQNSTELSTMPAQEAQQLINQSPIPVLAVKS
ncbi:MAG: universal stress protein [Bacteroidales bacterium]